MGARVDRSSTRPNAMLTYHFSRGKEVACGGISFFVHNFITHHMVKETYGIPTAVYFCPSLSDHVQRKRQIIYTPQGLVILGGFAPLLVKARLLIPAAPVSIADYNYFFRDH